MIFCGGPRRAVEVRDMLMATMPQLEMRIIHGEMPSWERTETLRAFADDDFRILICSDVVTRGCAAIPAGVRCEGGWRSVKRSLGQPHLLRRRHARVHARVGPLHMHVTS